MSPAKREKCWEFPCPNDAVRDGWCKQHDPKAAEAARLARNERARETVREYFKWHNKQGDFMITEATLAQWEQEPKP